MGAGEIDSLEIQVKATAQKANQSLDALIGKLDKLTTSLGKVNGNSIASLSNGVQRLANSMQSMKNIGTADFTRLANNIQKIGSIDSKQLGKAAGSIHRFVNALGTIDKINVSDNSAQIGQLAKGIKQLGYKSSTQAIENIPKLATATRQLMTELSKAPKVSQNLIQMTDALARLARTGSSSGRAATSLGKALDSYTSSTKRASNGTRGLASAIGKLYATYWLLFRAFSKIGDAISISSNLTEVQNVVDVTFGNMSRKVEEFAKTSIEQFGMSELSLKQYASRFQAMGSAMGISKGLVSGANKFLNEQTKGYVGLSNSMADVSLNLTKLAADMASFYNVEQKDVAEDLASIFTGQTRPLRTYGLDLSQATLKEWALKNGLDADIKSMSQAEKTMLRYQYVMANTGAAQGDFARTANTWANQVRILKQNFEQLGAVVGGTLINAFKPLVQALNSVMGQIISFAETVSNALGKIFGWKYESGSAGITNDLETAEDGADGIAGGLGDAADNAKKLKNNLLAIDELNVISPDEGKTSGSGSGSGGGAASGSSGSSGQWVKQDSIFEEYKSSIDSLYGLGEYLRKTLVKEVGGINWNTVYAKASGFGSGLAEFLNGLFSSDKSGNNVFTSTADVVAGSLNSVLFASKSFTDKFDFTTFGSNIASGINRFFDKFDFSLLAESLNGWVDGLEDSIAGFLKTVKWSDILYKAGTFLGDLELDTVAVIIGALTFRKAASLTKAKITEQLLLMLGGSITIDSLAVTIMSILPKFSGTNAFVDTVVFEIASFIDQGITDAFKDSSIGIGILNAIGGAIAGAAAGGVAGSWFPGVGTVAGAIIGAITGAFANVEIDGSSILQKIVDKIFNFDTANFLMEDAAERLKKAFGTEMMKDGSFDFAAFGENFVLGLAEGIVGALSYIVEPIKDLFDYIGTTICDVFGIHSPAKNMEPYGKNILLGLVNGFSDSVSEFSTAISTWWTEHVEPWFTTDKWESLGETAKSSIIGKFESMVADWQTKISDWWKNDVSAWFQEKDWNTLADVISGNITLSNAVSQWQTDISTWWRDNVSAWFKEEDWQLFADLINGKISLSDAVSQWKTDISTWWKDDVEKWFTKKKWNDSMSGVIDAFKETWGTAISSVKQIWNGFAKWLNEKLTWTIDPVVIAGKTVFDGTTISLGKIPTFQVGGFPEDGLFMANHTELVGQFSNGKTAVRTTR